MYFGVARTVHLAFMARPALLAAALCTAGSLTAAPLTVVTTVPDLAYAIQVIGGSHVTVQALLSGAENPHYIDAKPEFVRAVAHAQIVCLAGLDLEADYMPAVLERAGNKAVLPSGKGYCEIGRAVRVLGKPGAEPETKLRSLGDVHPGGNPHYWLGPSELVDGSSEIVAVLTRVDPAHATDYLTQQKIFIHTMQELVRTIRAQLAPIIASSGAAKRPLIMEYHREFLYFLAEYGLKSYGSIEDKAGAAPAAGRLAEVALAAQAAGVRVLLAAEDVPAASLAKFHELSGIAVVTAPTMTQPHGKYKGYAQLQQHLAAVLSQALRTDQAGLEAEVPHD